MLESCFMSPDLRLKVELPGIEPGKLARSTGRGQRKRVGVRTRANRGELGKPGEMWTRSTCSEGRLFRGITFGLALSLPFWTLVAATVWIAL